MFAGPRPVRSAEKAAHMRRLAGSCPAAGSGRRPGRERMPQLIHSQAGTTVSRSSRARFPRRKREGARSLLDTVAVWEKGGLSGLTPVKPRPGKTSDKTH